MFRVRDQEMTLERFAARLTDMQTGGLFPTLARHGLTEREWARARHHWLRRAVSGVAVHRALSAELHARQAGPSALQPNPEQLGAAAPRPAAQ